MKLMSVISRPSQWFLKTRRRTKFIIIVLLMVGGFIVYGRISNANPQSQVLTETVQRQTLISLVSETGNVSTVGKADVFSTSTGIIEEVFVNNSDVVKVGQNLFRVKSTATDQEKAAANATYQSAVSALRTAEQTKLSLQAALTAAGQAKIDAQVKVDFKNTNVINSATGRGYTVLESESIDKGLLQANQNLELAQKKANEADAAITAARAQINSALLAFQATQTVTIKAPTSGTIVNLTTKPGDKVTAGTGAATTVATSSAPVLTIVNLARYEVSLLLNEVDIPKVKVGQSAQLTLDSFQDQKFEGKVTHVDTVGANDLGVVTYKVIIEITNPDIAIRPVMTANVDIEVARVENVLSVPNSAIKPYKGGKAVQVYDAKSKQPAYIPIKIGVRGIDKTEVVEGVTEGMEVITALQNGQVNRSGSTILGGGQ